jgi:hypothetical protein
MLIRRLLPGLLLGAALLASPTLHADPFTFQGFLEQSGTPLNGNANLAFKLYDAQSGGSQLGSTITANPYPVLDGVFTIDLNFAGVAFAEANRWLQVEVGGTPLGPRIEMLATPLASSTRALQGRGVSATAPSSGQVLKWNGSAWAPAADNGGSSYSAGSGLTLSGTTFSVSFAGSGAANSASRSDHDHYGQIWGGSATDHGLWVENSFDATEARALFGNYNGPGTRGTGVRGNSNAPDGIGVLGSGTEGVRGLSNAGAAGVGVFGWRDVAGGAGIGGLATGDATTVAVRGFNTAAGGTAMLGVSENTGSGSGVGVHGKSLNLVGIGVHGEATETAATGDTVGVLGTGGATGVRGLASYVGVNGRATNIVGIGVLGVATHASGVVQGIRGEAYSPDGAGIMAVNHATTGAPKGLYAYTLAPNGNAVLASGSSVGGIGVRAVTTGTGPAVLAENFGTVGLATALRAVNASLNGTTSVFEANGSGESWAIDASSSGLNGRAVYAALTNAATTGSAIYAQVNASGATAVQGVNQAGGLAGDFFGNVAVSGTLSKGGGSFKIDHPLDPANKYLLHSFVESPDMMNVYNGNVVTDANGRASIELPEWFETLNRDFRYQLTVIGTFAQAIVSKKVAQNRFEIRTNVPQVEVSWQVTGIRQDAWAERNRIPVELKKSGDERGKFLHPEAHGQPADKRIGANADTKE